MARLADSKVEGVVVDRRSRRGRSGLRVDLLDGTQLLAATTTGQEGDFVMLVPDLAAGRRLSLQVVDGGRVLATQAVEVGRPVRVVLGEAPTGGPRLVFGRVRDAQGEPLVGVELVAYDRAVRGGRARDVELARGRSDAAGRYRLAYRLPPERSAGRDRADLFVLALDSEGAEVGRSALRTDAPARARLDLEIAGDLVEPTTVFAGLMRAVLAEGVEPQTVVALRPSGLRHLAARIAVEAEELHILAEAQALEARCGLPAELAFGLGAAGLSLHPSALLHTSPGQARALVARAAEAGQIDPQWTERVEASLRSARARLAEAGGSVELLTAAGLEEEEATALVIGHLGLGEAAEAEEALPDTSPRAALSLALANLAEGEPSRAAGLRRLVQDRGITALEGLLQLSVEDLSAALGAEATEAEEVRAAPILAERAWTTLRKALPGAWLAAELAEAPELSAEARRLLPRLRGRDLRVEPVSALLAGSGAEAEGEEAPSAEVIEEIEGVARVVRITRRADQVRPLLGAGLRSAAEIAEIPEDRFVEDWSPALGGAGGAARVHAQAVERAGAAQAVALALHQAQEAQPFALAGARPAAPPPNPLIKVAPGLDTLFGAQSWCACDHCRSVYSPAAYLVDLLSWLDAVGLQPGAGRQGPTVLDVLLRRRPDLARIPLTCANTNTPLPYIDLVNEVLEAAVLGQPDFVGDNGGAGAAELRAMPQRTLEGAYALLAGASYPWTLPFDRALEGVRAFLTELGGSRLSLMRELRGPEGPSPEALVAESLGMSLLEAAFIAGPPTPARHFDLGEAPGGAAWVERYSVFAELMRVSGLSANALIELVQRRFVNPGDRVVILAPGSQGDPSGLRLAGLDEAWLDRAQRFVRLQQRLKLSAIELDRALVALQATTLELSVLERLSALRELSGLLGVGLAEAGALIGPIDTLGPQSLYDRLIGARAVIAVGASTEAFRLRPDRAELAVTADDLGEHLGLVSAAFGVSQADLALLLAARPAPPPRSLAGLTELYRVVLLARGLGLSIRDLLRLLALTPARLSPFVAGDPRPAVAFVQLARRASDGRFSFAQLDYLCRHQDQGVPSPRPSRTQTRALLDGLRQALLDAEEETTAPADAGEDFLRSRLARVLDEALVAPAMAVLDPRSPDLDRAARQAFVARYLGDLLPADSPVVAQLGALPAAEGDDEAAVAADPGEAAYRTAIRGLLEVLLPNLRRRLQRERLLRTLAEGLSLDLGPTRLLVTEHLKASRGPNSPLLDEFLALLGAGLSATYTPAGGGSPVQRLDGQLKLDWGRDRPAGLAAGPFSVRWQGSFQPRADGPHRFEVRTDGGVRLRLRQASGEALLIDSPAPERPGKARTVGSEAVALDASQLYTLELEHNSPRGSGVFELYVSTSPAARALVPRTALYPADGLRSLAGVEAAYLRLHKCALLITGFGLSEAELAVILAQPAFDLNRLPVAPVQGGSGWFEAWMRLAEVVALRGSLPGNVVFHRFLAALAGPPERVVAALCESTSWEPGPLQAVLEGLGLVPHALRIPEAADQPWALVAVAAAMERARRMGVPAARLFAWARQSPDATQFAEVLQAAKARYPGPAWLEVARSRFDPLREAQRRALVDWMVPRLAAQGVRNANQLFELLLIDVEMCACMDTSRIKQAISSVQTFVQRCLMGLEPAVPPERLSGQGWRWRKNYRVWEANRKVFLYPENWLEPELRDDKTPFFRELEQDILQTDITDQNVGGAFLGYLQKLDGVARLDVRGVWMERQPGKPDLFHVFGRTYNQPHRYATRRFINGREWTPWEAVDVDIEGDHLIPVVWHQRLLLCWLLFQEVEGPAPSMSKKEKKEGKVVKPIKHWELRLGISELENGRWTPKRISEAVIRTGEIADRRALSFLVEGFDRSALRMGVFSEQVTSVTVSSGRRRQRRSHTYRSVKMLRLGGFVMESCRGEIGVSQSEQRDGARPVPFPGFAATAGGFVGRGALSVSLPNFPQTAVLARTGAAAVRAITSPTVAAAASRSLQPFVLQGDETFFVRVQRPSSPAQRLTLLRTLPLRIAPVALPVRRPGRRGRGRAREEIELFEDTDLDERRPPPRRRAPARPALRRPARRPGRPSARPVARPAPTPAPQVIRHTLNTQLRFSHFQHDFVCQFVEILRADGIKGLLAPRSQWMGAVEAGPGAFVPPPPGQWRPTGQEFARRFGPSRVVDLANLPELGVEFRFGEPYATYNWELFFHIPLLVATRLMQERRHEEAMGWFHHIFDPTTDSREPAPQRYWKLRPFHENTELLRADELISLLAVDRAALARSPLRGAYDRVSEQVAAWIDAPFAPHVIARLRLAAYQKSVVMKYIDNLVAWGDQLFRRDTIETINEATQLYILAANILGPRPEAIPPIVSPPPLSFAQLRASARGSTRDGKAHAYFNSLIALEGAITARPFRAIATPPDSRQGAASLLGMGVLYFCVPPNDKLLGYWDTVADRLFKIRNCMNIEGVVRKLPLFEPPLDPALLLRGLANAGDIGAALADLNSPPPALRFGPLLRLALSVTEDLRHFGLALLGALEKRDAEALAGLKATHEVNLQKVLREVDVAALKEAEAERQAIEKEREELLSRRSWLEAQEPLNDRERLVQDALGKAIAQKVASNAAGILARVLHMIPNFQAGTAGGFSSPFVTLELGGDGLGSAGDAFSAAMEMVGEVQDVQAQMAEQMAEHQRRREAWEQEKKEIDKAVEGKDREIAAARLREDKARQIVRIHDRRVSQAEEIERVLRDRYTNRELYVWMVGQISALYFQAYKVAFDLGKMAERAHRFEQGVAASPAFVAAGHWDSLRKGLLAGERLRLDLRRLELAHIEGARREAQLTRTLSLSRLDPLALLQLRATGVAEIELPESLWDTDHPGHYFRRIKAVSLTLPDLPPRSAVHCTLTLLRSRVRIDARLRGGYAEAEEGEDARFAIDALPVQSMSTSQSVDDAGLFELRFQDEALLPFEGAGLISRWRIELPQRSNDFPLESVSDLQFTLRYTARDGGAPLRAAALAQLDRQLQSGGAQRMWSLRTHFPEVWAALTKAGSATLPLTTDRLPPIYRGRRIAITGLELVAQTAVGVDLARYGLALGPERDAPTPAGAWTAPWASAGVAFSRARLELSGAPGPWSLKTSTTPGPELQDLFVVLRFTAAKSGG